ncbi:Chitinase [Micromonospora noduli]|nr:Chitinase [Micromonospora noduli]
MSPTARPSTPAGCTALTSTRSYASTSEIAPRIRSTIATGFRQPRPGAEPARMTRSSACRRSRVARWSTWNSSASSSGSSLRRSIRSSRCSWRCTRLWLRRAMLRKTSLSPRRRVTSSTAAWTAVRCTSVKARPTSPISSWPYSSGGASRATSTCSPRRSRATTSGSRCSASSSAAVRTPLSRRTRVRPTRSATSTETTTATSPSTPAAASRTRMRTAIGTERSVRASASDSSKSRNCCCTASWLACQDAASTVGRPDRLGTTSASCMLRSRVNASLSVNRWYATRLLSGRSATALSVSHRWLPMACTSWVCSPSANRPAVSAPASSASLWPSSSRERPSAVSAKACRLMSGSVRVAMPANAWKAAETMPL